MDEKIAGKNHLSAIDTHFLKDEEVFFCISLRARANEEEKSCEVVNVFDFLFRFKSPSALGELL